MPPPRSAPSGPPEAAIRGAGFDGRKIRFWCWALLASYPGLLAGLWARGLVPLEDFSVFWAAGRLALAGDPAAVYDWTAIHRLQPVAAHVATFFYPPLFLLVLAPLALLPFAVAGVAWVGATLAAYLAAAQAILPGRTALMAALAAPMVVFNLTTGQNGLLTTALLGGALALVEARPVASGVLIGLLAYKPHFGVLLPLFLVVTGRWRVFAAAALTVVLLVAATGGVFGWQVFAAFARAGATAGDAYLEHARFAGALPWDMLASLYGMLRALGAGATAAWSAHVALAALAGGAALWLAAGDAAAALKAAGLVTAAFLLTPYSERDDLAILLLPLAFLVRDGLAGGFAAWEVPALATVYALPLIFPVLWVAVGFVAPVPGSSLVGLGPAMGAALVALIAFHVIKSRRDGKGRYR